VCDTDVVRPSAADRAPGLTERVDGDLDNIVLMAMRKERERRYKSVDQFAEDLERYLHGLPVLARQDSFAYRARKFVGRHRLPIGAAAIVLLSILAGPTLA